MDFSSLNLSDIQASPESEPMTESPESEQMETPKVSEEIKSQLDKLDPMDIINYLKGAEILPIEFELPEEGEEELSEMTEQPGSSIFGDLSLDEVDTPVNVAGGD